MEEIRAVDISRTQRSIKLWHRRLMFPLLACIAIVDGYFFRSGYILAYVLLGIILGSSFIPNYIVLAKIKCPYCGKNYFRPKFCGREEMKLTLESDQSCVHCEKKARIISES